MSKKFDWMKRGLMGSTTLAPTAGLAGQGHVHKADGSCCGHDHAHHHAHEGSCGHDHEHDEDCTSPKGGCC